MTPTTDQAAREAAEKRDAERIDHFRKIDMTREQALAYCAKLERERIESDAEWSEEMQVLGKALNREHAKTKAALAEREAECESLKREKQAVERDWGELFLLKNKLSEKADSLAAEAERLRGENQELAIAVSSFATERFKLEKENAALREQVEGMKKDGEILNALQAEWRFQLGDGWAHRASVAVHMGEDIRQAITAARGESE